MVEYIIENSLIIKKETTEQAVNEICIGNETFNEYIFDEQGSVTSTTIKKFNIEKGEYEIVTSE
jgi:hypothetical protein